MGKVLRIVQGNTFGTAIEINAVDAEGHAIQDFSLDGSTDIRVWYVFAGKEVDVEAWSIDDGKVVILWDGRSEAMRLGTYDIFIEGMFEETAWRNAMKSQFTLVKYNYEAYIPDDVIVLNGIYQLTAQMSLITRVSGGGGGTPSQTIPLMDGEASVGEENAYARGDHRHPTDTTRQAVINDLDAIRSGAQKGETAYQKPNNGIPSTDMAQAVQTSLGKADTAYQKPANGIPATDLASAVQTSLGKADTAYQKPSSGIPATDLASAVQTSLGKADTSIQSVKVNGTALTPDANKAVDVSVPTVIDSLSSASTTSALSANQGKVLNDGKQDKIDNAHKLSADLVDDTSTTNKFVTSSEKSTWGGKQDALVSGTNIKTINNESILGSGNITIQGGGGISTSAAQALLNCFNHVAWIDQNGATYIALLRDLLLPLVDIRADYTQSHIVWSDGVSTLDDLKQDLTVYGEYYDGTEIELDDYQLSGTLLAGTSVVSVEYQGLTTSFNVSVTQYGSKLSYNINDLTIVATGFGDNSTTYGFTVDGTVSSSRKHVFISYGNDPIRDKNGVEQPYYGIAVPKNATKVTVSVTPNTVMVGGYFTWMDGVKRICGTPIATKAYTAGGYTYSFTQDGQTQFYFVAPIKMSSGNIPSGYPTGLSIEFE